ncbi:MAG: hypothetical protein ACXWC9_05215 [Pseudobdellovibrionaceae bacterium]
MKALFGRHPKLSFVPGQERSPFESLVRAIAHQQLHGKAAETILGRMLAHFPGKEFPSPDDILILPEEKLRERGYSRSKTKSIRDIAAHAQSGVVPTSKDLKKIEKNMRLTRQSYLCIYGAKLMWLRLKNK